MAALEKVGQISQIYDGQWLFKALLAPKPHQEQISNNADFVWQFCLNYTPLNQVTRQIAYPIWRCNNAVKTAFGRFWMWLYNAIMGYHQLSIAKESRAKLAFQGPDAIKWTYNVMLFGPTNSPATFIMMIHDVNSIWKQIATSLGMTIGVTIDMRIIIDDIIN
jgi:hypothetical protein